MPEGVAEHSKMSDIIRIVVIIVVIIIIIIFINKCLTHMSESCHYHAIWYMGAGTSMAHLFSNRKFPMLAELNADYHMVCHKVRSSGPFYLFSTQPTSMEKPWNVEFKSTYTPTTPRSMSAAMHRIINLLPLICWPGYRILNPG